MNICEEEQLEEKFNEITDQIGYLLLDFLLISLKKINIENQVFKSYEDCKLETYCDKDFFKNQQGTDSKVTP